MNEFLNWLFSEAGAGYIAAVLILVGWLISYIRRERPSKVIVQEVSHKRLLDIHPRFRAKLEILYGVGEDKTEIENLEQKILYVYNYGTKNINEPLELELSVQQMPLFVQYSHRGRGSGLVTDYKYNAIHLRIPYLNSYRKHGSYVAFFVVTDTEIKLNLRHGEGKGWSAKFISREEVKNWRSKLRNWGRTSLATAFALAFGYAVLVVFSQYFDFWMFQSADEIYKPFATTAVVFYVLFVVFTAFQNWFMKIVIGIVPSSEFGN